jgi:hypothetical protein
MTAEPLSEREIEELQWLLSESFIGGKLIQHPRYPQQVFPDGSSDAFCTVQVSNVECWDKRAGLIAAAINALPRLIAASRPTDRGEPVAEHLLQAYGLTTAIGRMTHSADEDAQIDPDDAQDAMDSLIGRAREIMSLPSTATAPYAQDLSEPRPAMATGRDLKDHPNWKGDLRAVSECLGFFASVIKSGEPWTETCQRKYDEARAMLASTPATEGA